MEDRVGDNREVAVISQRHNLRDYGGLSTSTGARLVSGRLFRSGELDHCLPADEDMLQRLHVGTVIDLRSPVEFPPSPPPFLSGFSGRLLRTEAAQGAIPHLMGRYAGLANAQEMAAGMADTYRTLPFLPRFRDALRLYFEGLAQEHAGSLVHCFAGKDRTGLCVALFHRAMGVHEDDMMADYLLTNEMGEARMQLCIDGMLPRLAFDIPLDHLRVLFSVQPAYLHAALEQIVERHGDVPAYLRDVGIGSDTIKAISLNYLR
nr:tyrosine-protein phosphatase [Sandaracinobacteroides sayramensis]